MHFYQSFSKDFLLYNDYGDSHVLQMNTFSMSKWLEDEIMFVITFVFTLLIIFHFIENGTIKSKRSVSYFNHTKISSFLQKPNKKYISAMKRFTPVPKIAIKSECYFKKQKLKLITYM